MNKPLISVIVPVYNVEAYLHQCVDSIINQTYKNLEIILVNDGSTDSSGAICGEYASQDSRVRVIHKPNGGLSSARNAGMDIMTGEYVSFVDSDDWLELDIYEKCISRIKLDPSLDVIRFQVKCFYIDREEIHKEVGGEQYFNFTLIQQAGKVSPIVWSSIYKTSLINGLNLRFKEGVIHEDNLFSSELYVRSLNIRALFIEDIGYCYRREREGSITQGNNRLRSVRDLSTGFVEIIDRLYSNDPERIPLFNGYALKVMLYVCRSAVESGISWKVVHQNSTSFWVASRANRIAYISLGQYLWQVLFRACPYTFIKLVLAYRSLRKK